MTDWKSPAYPEVDLTPDPKPADLNPQQFHGTHADLHPGDRVLPAGKTGVRTNYPDMRTVNGDTTRAHAFSTSSEKEAWAYARRDTPLSARSAVLRVHPHPDQQKGVFHDNGISGEMVAPYFDVAERHDIMPGRQGTFPLNWNQFAKHDALDSIGDEYNHPHDQHIEDGHSGGDMSRASRAAKWGLEDLMDEPEHDLHAQGKLF